MKRCPICKKEFQNSGRCPDDGVTLVEAEKSDPMIGKEIQGYRIERVLGAGGLGVVYLAKQLTLDRFVAIKLLHTTRHGLEEALPRFLREARLLSQLNHPNIVQIIEFGNTEDGLAFLAMEFVTGVTLKDYVDERGGLHLGQALSIAKQLVAAVQAAHELKIIHRDLKPQNILISTDAEGQEQVKLLDFGIGKSLEGNTNELTNTAMVLGTPGYLAPEQIQSAKEADARADIYAVGAIIYFMIAGRTPYKADNVASLLALQLIDRPAPLVFEELHDPTTLVFEDVIFKALQKDPADRFQSARELAAAIRSLSKGPRTGEDEEVTVAAALAPAAKSSARRRIPNWVSAVSCCSLLLLSVLGWSRWSGATQSVNPPTVAEVSGVRGISGTEIVLGMSAAFSGAAREIGRGMKLGVETALAEANKQGGVAGRTLRLIALDDAYEPERAVANTKELLEKHKVFAMIGNVGTPTTTEVLPLLLDSKTILFGPFTGADKLRRDPPDRYVFNYRASYREEVQELVKYFVTKRQIEPKKIAVFSQDDGFGASGLAAVQSVLATYGVDGRDVLNVTYSRNSRLAEPAVAKVLEHQQGVQAVIVFATYGASARFTRLLREKGATTLVANVSFVGSAALAEEFLQTDLAAGKGVITTEVVPRVDGYSTLAQRFNSQVATYFPNERPDSAALEGYVATRLLLEGLRRAGRAVDTERLTNTFEAVTRFDIGSGTHLTFSPSDHQASHKVWANVLDEHGRWQDLEL